MGHRITGSGNAWAMQQNSATSGWQQRQQGMKDLFSAIKAGDLESAKKAFDSMNLSNGTLNNNSSLAQIGKALASGDMETAQSEVKAMLNQHSNHHKQQVSLDAKKQITNEVNLKNSNAAAFLGIGTQVNTVA